MNIYKVDAGFLYYVYNGKEMPTEWQRETDDIERYTQTPACNLVAAQNREQARLIFVQQWQGRGFRFADDDKISIRKLGEDAHCSIGVLDVKTPRNDLYIAPPSDKYDIPF